MVLSEAGKALTRDEMEMSLFTYQAVCREVTDGDTIELDLDLGMRSRRHETIRLYGIDTPEIHGVKHDSDEFAAGLAASKRVCNLLRPHKVGRTLTKYLGASEFAGDPIPLWVETHKDKTGKYGRYLATVWYEDLSEDGQAVMVCLNELLVSEKLAEHRSY